MPPVIDSHQHFWQRSQPYDYRWLQAPALAPINRDFLPPELEPRLQATGVDCSIVVQTQHNLDENRWALKLCEQHPRVAGVVGWVDLASEQCEAQLEEFAGQERFVGVRHVTQDEPDDDFIVRPDILRGLAVLEKHDVPFDLLFYVKHLHHVPTLARRLPNLRMVINHLSKPRIREQVQHDWLPHLQAAAKFPNVYCKLSGLITEADWNSWQPADIKPYVQAALAAFGPDRCMFGSDWPVCNLAGTYEQVVAALREALGKISANESAAIFGGTAQRFYRLQLP